MCISFIHIPTFFDDGRSQRIFNLINKDPAFAPLVEHPTVLAMMDVALGRDLIALDVSVNHVGPHTASGGWHVDSPITQIPEPLPNFTLSIQSAWMLDDFTEDNGATHVVRGSHTTQRKPPGGRDRLADEVVLEGPAGSLAIWLSQTWHRHGANVTDAPRCGVIVQYGRSWVKPFVDLRTPMTAEQAEVVLAPAALPARLQRQPARPRLARSRAGVTGDGVGAADERRARGPRRGSGRGCRAARPRPRRRAGNAGGTGTPSGPHAGRASRR